MDDQFKKYLQDKYELEKQYGTDVDRLNTAQAFSNLGDVIAGRTPGSQNQYYAEQRSLAKQPMSDYEKALQRQMDISFKNAMIAKQEAKQQSDEAYQKEKLELEKKGYNLREKELLGKKASLNEPEIKMQKLSGTDKARFDNAKMVLQNLDEMAAALDRGENTFSLIGDNPYTAAARNATEAYGRMQSGGAINKEEERRFEKVLPSVSDSAEMQRNKILKQRKEMISRLKTLGFTPEDVGVNPEIDFKYGKSEQVQKERVPYQGKIYEFQGGDRNDRNNWKVVGE